MTSYLRNAIADHLWIRSVRKHRSRLGRRDAPRYTNYLESACIKPVKNRSATVGVQATQFLSQGWSSFADEKSTDLAKSMLSKIKAQEAAGLDVWDADGRYKIGEIYQCFPEVESFFQGEVGGFLREVYGADFKIFYGLCYHSIHDPDGPQGSQHWHADGGPGTCINLMWCLSPVSSSNGAMECLSWSDTLKIFEKERKATRAMTAASGSRLGVRSVLTAYYKNAIEADYASRINQPVGQEGLIFAFSNNILHKGGYPKPDQERYVCVFHIYPSTVPTKFDQYRLNGIAKTAGYPVDPKFGD